MATGPVVAIHHHNRGVRFADQGVGERHSHGARTDHEVVGLDRPPHQAHRSENGAHVVADRRLDRRQAIPPQRMFSSWCGLFFRELGEGLVGDSPPVLIIGCGRHGTDTVRRLRATHE
jgi:hypothetical protein